MQVKDWVCNDPGCPSLDELLKETKKETYKLNHLPKLSKFGDKKKKLSLNIHGKFLENLAQKKTTTTKKHWKRDQNEIVLTEFSVNKFLKTCFAPFFQCLQINT